MTQTYEHLIYETDDDNICWLTLNRPECLNAFNKKLVAELRDGLERADADDAVHVIVIRGAGRAFSSGHDLKEDAEDEFASIYHYRTHYFRQFEEFTTPWRITKPVIASVRSIAIGKGFELTLFCDVTIVSDDTRLGYNEVRYGISAHCMFLPWLVNMRTAKDLLLTGREVTASEAKEMGLVTEVVPLQKLEEATLRKAKLMARLPVEMQRAHKMYLNRVYEIQGLRNATDQYLELLPAFGYTKVREYEAFVVSVNEKGLRRALAEANSRYEGLDAEER
jgi:enoyl-CoA hydratase/carnithine racemase